MGLGPCEYYQPGYVPCLNATSCVVVWYFHRDAPSLLGDRDQRTDPTVLPDAPEWGEILVKRPSVKPPCP